MLAHVAGGDEIVAGRLGQFLQQGGRIDPLARRVIAGGVALGARGAADDPRVDGQRPRIGGHQGRLQVAAHADGRRPQLGDFRRVDVVMDDAGVRRELGQLAGGAVVEAGAQNHQQIGFLDRLVGRAGPVHSDHAQEAGRVRGDGAQGVQGRDSGDARPLDESAQFIDRPGDLDPAAHIQDRAFRRAVLHAYDARCAVTGWKLINGGGRAEAEAAHIRPVERGGPDSVRNGLALSGTAHWMFDRGLIGLSDDLDILISRQVNDRPSVEAIVNRSGKALVPELAAMRPHPAFLGWHRDNCFKH